jgi:hypothetical protein
LASPRLGHPPFVAALVALCLVSACTRGEDRDGDARTAPADSGPPAADLALPDAARVDGGGGVETDLGADGARLSVDAGPPSEPCNGVDDDGDSEVDEGCSCGSGTTQPCFVGAPELAGVGACVRGEQRCVNTAEFGVWGACVGSGAASAEVCDNGADDDCDGVVDEDCTPLSCAPGDLPTPEVCRNGVDEDCDSLIDEDCETGRVVGRAVAFGAGRVVVWGDEHVTFDSYGDAVRPFWSKMLGWLACSGCATSGTSVVSNRSLPDAVIADAAAAGLTVRSSFGAGFDASADVLILVGSTEVDPDALADWVWAGGGLMVMSVGFGDSFECDGVNNPLFQLPLRFDCSTPNPWGPVDTIYPHPTTLGLVPDNTPFVNGRWVIEDPGTGSTVLARVP